MSPSPFNLPALLILLTSATLPARVVPNFSDLTIKTRRVDHLNSSVETLYLKGARQRREYLRDKPVNSSFVSISRCDDRKRIDLNDNAKLYAELPIVDRSEQRKRARPISTSEMTGEDVIVTTDSVDTGERRRMGTYTARHVQTTITLEAGPDAAMPFTVEERDGWYIDLPGLGCQDSGKQVGFVYANLGPARRYHRIQVKRLGMAPAGFPLEQTLKRTEQGKSTLSKVELLEFSQAPLSDDALFQVPQGYSPALGTGHRGYDMTRPRTLANRAQMYWAELKILATQWFR